MAIGIVRSRKDALKELFKSLSIVSAMVLPATGMAGTTELVSLANDGSQAPQQVFQDGDISANGRYVAFRTATLAGAGDAPGNDIYLRDLATDTTELVSINVDGSPMAADARPAISANGRYVAFSACGDIFVRDRVTNTTEQLGSCKIWPLRPFVTSAGAISDDGRYVVYGPNIRDRVTGTDEPWAVTVDGAPPDAHVYLGYLSGDGRHVVFASGSTNFVQGDTNGKIDIFVRDLVAHTTKRVSVDSNGTQANGDSDYTFYSISSDGRYIAFTSRASNLVPGDTNSRWDAFVHDQISGTTERVNVSSTGAQGWYAQAKMPYISADGRYVAFSDTSTNLVPNDTNNQLDVFVRDRVRHTTERVSVASDGSQAVGGGEYRGSWAVGIAGCGQVVAFQSGATNLVANDTNGVPDMFVNAQCRLP